WTGKKEYLDVVSQTLEFINRHWSDPSGGFYSSYDADSEGEEGKYYVWTTQELETLIPDEHDRKMFYELNDIQARGNWEEGKNILQIHRQPSELARKYNLSDEAFAEKIKSIQEKLLSARSKRIPPGLDDKILTSWNGLMLQGYVDAYRVTGTKDYLDRALKNARFIAGKMIQEGNRLNRNYKNGKSTINGFLDDYAITIQAFLSLYQCTFDSTWLNHADGLMKHVLAHFDGDSSGLFYYTSDLDPALIARRVDFGDNVIPSSNSILARDLYVLGTLLDFEAYIHRSRKMFNTVWPRIQADEQPSFYSNWCQLMLSMASPPYEVAIVGDQFATSLAAMQLTYQPDALYLGGRTEGTLPLLEHKEVPGQTVIYVCRNKVCK
ncbi:MAG TPA: hypothetical protein VJ508_08230, partial [Saprospiraceae bacterium]|nr:hypothetical protein [Saprospiraceae bacterium]